jgi:hypothetical protein
VDKDGGILNMTDEVLELGPNLLVEKRDLGKSLVRWVGEDWHFEARGKQSNHIYKFGRCPCHERRWVFNADLDT